MAHAPTTLSIEERRVQESLDRLDRQLKGTRVLFSPFTLISFNSFADVEARTRSTSNTRLQK